MNKSPGRQWLDGYVLEHPEELYPSLLRNEIQSRDIVGDGLNEAYDKLWAEYLKLIKDTGEGVPGVLWFIAGIALSMTVMYALKYVYA